VDQIPPQKQSFPSGKQAVVITVCGFAMALFGCLGAISVFERSDVLGYIGIAVFVIGSLAFLFGLLLVAYLFFRALFRGSRTPPLPPPPPPPGDSPKGQ
jgi:hypothetical protein